MNINAKVVLSLVGYIFNIIGYYYFTKDVAYVCKYFLLKKEKKFLLPSKYNKRSL